MNPSNSALHDRFTPTSPDKDLFDANFDALRQEMAALERRVEARLEAMELRFEQCPAPTRRDH